MKRKQTIWYHHQDPSAWLQEYPECSMYEFMAQNSGSYPERYALDFEGKKTRYCTLLEQIDIAAQAFQALGVEKGDIVSIMSPNIPQAAISVYALNRIGAIANMLHPQLSANEAKSLMRHTDSRLVVVFDQLAANLLDLDWSDGLLPTFLLLDAADALPFHKQLVYRAKNRRNSMGDSRCISWRSAQRLGRGQTLQPAATGGDDIAVIMYSGGTTGVPKGVMLTNRNFNALAVQSYDTMGIRNVAGFQALDILPIFHGTGLGVCVHSMLCYGFQVYLLPVFQLEKCVKLIFKHKIEFIFGVPAFFEGIARSVEIEEESCGFMRVLGSCGDKLPQRTRELINRHLRDSGSNTTITNGYGMTECTAGCCYEPFFCKKEGSSGMMVPDMDFKIVAPGTQTELPCGEVGELCIAGPTVMKGYYKNQEATSRILQTHSDGIVWLHSGDAFFADEDGYLYFQQRLDRMFVVSGYNIYPSAIENVISKVPGVDQCCVVGKKDIVVGRKITAYVILRKGFNQQETMAEIKAQCKLNLPEYSQPRSILFLPEFPLTKMKKVNYLELEKM